MPRAHKVCAPVPICVRPRTAPVRHATHRHASRDGRGAVRSHEAPAQQRRLVMAELTTDAAALSEAATNFDGIDHFFLFEDGSSEAEAAFVRFREAATKQIQELNTISENINRS